MGGTSLAELKGKAALIVGGSSGIGFALAKGFIDAGARVAVAARTEAKVREAEEALRQRDATAAGYVADVTRHADIADLAARFAADFGVPDILVNCQGATVIKPASEVTEGEFDRVIEINLKSVFFTCTMLAAPMLERGAGAVINIASLSAHRGWRNAAAYAMTKHGVLGLTRTLAAEWASSGVRVNSISPGVFLTELNRDRMPKERREAALVRTPFARFGETEELVGAAVYLASDAAGFVTGADIVVDGGYLASGI